MPWAPRAPQGAMGQLLQLVPQGQQESVDPLEHPIQESLGPLGHPIQESPDPLGHPIQESPGPLGHPIQGPRALRVAVHLSSSAYRPALARRFSTRWATTRFSFAC